MHYDIIIADDLHSQNNTRTKYQIDQVIEHYRLLLPILERDGLLIVIGTRWGEQDAYETIEKDCSQSLFIPAASTKPYTQAAIQHKSNKPMLVYDHVTNNSMTSDEFYLNFPNALPASHLEVIEQRQGPYIFSAQYLLHPVAAKESRFREEWLRFYEECETAPMPYSSDFDPTKPRNLNDSMFRRVGLVDPAFSTSAYSDYSGLVVIAADCERNMYIKHAEQTKLEPFQLIEKIMHLACAHNVTEWYVEEVAAQKVLRFFLDYMAGKEELNLSIMPVKSGGRKKELRIMSLQPYFSRGKVFLKKEQVDLIYQIRKFPIIMNDDILDALAYAPQVVYDGTKPEPLATRPSGLILKDLLDELKEARENNDGIRPRNYESPHRARSYYVG